MSHHEIHRLHRSNWLRASVLGANDGIISTASLILGMLAGGASPQWVLLAGGAGLVAGAISMGAGEYVSVCTQSDIEGADLAKEQEELIRNPEGELLELKAIYIARGLEPELALEVAKQLTEHDALGAHARDELGIHEHTKANPIQAALSSMASFSLGALIPLIVAFILPIFNFSNQIQLICIALLSLLTLVALGALAAFLGGANHWKGAMRVGVGGLLAMLLSGIVGFGLGVS